ncbi:MAG TPA: VLRF1 family aeRF1-type release factor [Solirubrobacterales bacterium]|nr:VLRF1 family aeRF1-type release factor [Solirubrobacterales bacterium]
MSQPTPEELRELSEWRPPLGVLSLYLGFDPADRGGAWRTELRNGLDAVLEARKEAEHDQRVALRATAKRVLERFEDGDLRPPPRGEAGFVEVAEKGGAERWFGTAAPPLADACVEFGADPMVAPLVALSRRGADRAVALLSSERVRLLRCSEGSLEEVEDWELSITSLDWRERKSQSTNNPARAQGVSASGHDQFGERLDHNRQRFLAECGGLAARRLEADGLEQLIVFAPPKDCESFKGGFGSGKATLALGGEQDLISTPTGQLNELVAAAIDRLDGERERALVERAMGEAKGGSHGSAGIQETREALAEGRVDHLVFDGAIGEEAESLIRAALAGSAQVTVVRDELAEPLAEADGVAAILRY